MAEFTDSVDSSLGMDVEIKVEEVDTEEDGGDRALIQNLLTRMLVLETQVADLTSWYLRGQIEVKGHLVTRKSRKAPPINTDNDWEPQNHISDSSDFEQSWEFPAEDREEFDCKVCPGTEFDSLYHLAEHYTSTHSTESILTLPDARTRSRTKRHRFTKAKMKSLPPASNRPYIRDPYKKRKKQGAKIKIKGTFRPRPMEQPNEDGRYPCPDGCGRTFSRPYHAKYHVTACRGLRPFLCDICPRAFSVKASLEYHKKAVHFKQCHVLCSVCGRSVRNEYLKNHMLTHAGPDRPKHSCTTCDATFHYLEDLRVHERSRHTGERPFTCQQCGKSFKGRSTMRIHMLQHTGTTCKGCGARFRNAAQLRKHRLGATAKGSGDGCQIMPSGAVK